ncbi:MAG: TIGR04454 family lipoprotein [Leptospiraceae bacterium]|nr:TIGR04454 family lipoprotein [Leptospiraceae bacterium]
MKIHKYIVIILLLISIFIVNNILNSDPASETEILYNSVSPEECFPVVESLLENFGDMNPNATDEEKEKARVMLKPVLQKECESGKYDLDCLRSAKSIAELQSCKTQPKPDKERVVNSFLKKRCDSIVQSMVKNFDEFNPKITDNDDKILGKQILKSMVPSVLQIDCESGIYDLDCLESIKSIPEMKTCNKK